MAALITDEMLEHYAVIARWDDLADALVARYGGLAERLVMYLAEDSIRADRSTLPRWGEVARAVVAACGATAHQRAGISPPRPPGGTMPVGLHHHTARPSPRGVRPRARARHQPARP